MTYSETVFVVVPQIVFVAGAIFGTHLLLRHLQGVLAEVRQAERERAEREVYRKGVADGWEMAERNAKWQDPVTWAKANRIRVERKRRSLDEWENDN